MTLKSESEKDQFICLAQQHEQGSDQWRRLFVPEVAMLVSRTFAGRLPVKLQPIFNEEDLAQETAIKILNRMESDGSRLEIKSGFVVTVARRVLIDRVRQYLARKRTPESGFIDVSPTSSTDLLNDIGHQGKTPSQIEMNNEFWIAATSLLNPRERELIELKYNEDLTNEDIGHLFGKTPQAIRSLLFRVHLKLKVELSKCPEFESYL